MSAPEPPVSRYLVATDGLRLHYHDYANADAARAPVVCLPGLARSAADFDPIARALQAQGRRVVALDYRGRGLSGWDTDWRRYNFDVEEADIFAALADAGVTRALFVGTSRGGLHMMRIAETHPDLILASVLNDIGPQIEHAGLLRIKRYVGKLPPIATMKEAVALMRMTAGAHFCGVSAQEWEIYAQQTFVEADGKVTLRYDPGLAHTLDSVTPDDEPESYWNAFAELSKRPMLVVRGANSDILSQATLDKMARRAPHLQSWIVPGQGHAPLLLDAPTIARIVEFANEVG